MIAFLTEYKLILTTLFSGVGVAAIGWIGKCLYNKRKNEVKPELSQKAETGDNSTIYQSGSTIIVNPPQKRKGGGNNDE